MRMLLALISASLLSAAPALADDEAPKGDLAKLQGKWSGKGGPNKDFELKIEIKGKGVTVFFTPPDGGDEVQIKGELKVDEKATPKTLDWIKFKRPDNGDEMPDNLSLYELKDDEFKVCSGGPGNDRPKEIKEGDDGFPSVMIFKRVKEEKKDK